MNKVIIPVFVLLLLAQSAYALTGYVQPAKMILSTNITSHDVNMLNNSIELKNENDIPVVVDLSLDGFNGEFQENNISLNPNETKEVGFTIILTEEGNYTGSISASYSAEQGLPITLSCDILVYATANDTYVNNHAPSKPNLISPLNNSSGNETFITFEWSASTDQDGDTIAYHYQVDDGNFSNPEIQGATFATQKTVNVGHGKWYWRVIANDGMNNSSSDVWQLLINNPPFTPVSLNPPNNSVLNKKPILNWTSGDLDSDVITYDLVVDDDYNFTSPFINKVVTDSFYNTSSDNLQNQTYCWKVRSNDGFVKSDFSSVSCFTLNLTNQVPQPTCSDGIQNQGETGVDCGGPCSACQSSPSGNGGGGGGDGGFTSGSGSNNTSGSSGYNSTITNTTTNTTTTNTTTTAEQENITEEQNKTSQPENSTGFVFAVLTQYWLLGSILVVGVIGSYVFYKYREHHSSNYKWEQRWRK